MFLHNTEVKKIISKNTTAPKYYCADELAYLFIKTLKPGDSFKVNKTEISVIKVNPDGSMSWLVNGTKKRVHCTIGTYYGYNGMTRKPDWFIQYLRDIEGILIVDLLNVNNPFHQLSDIGKIIIK